MSSPSSSSEENVHMEVVVVTTPDTPDQEEKSILETEDLEEKHMMESEADSSASIALPKDAVLVKLSEVPDGDGEILYPITCGDSKANLVWKKFVCPGINIKCVQLNEHLISPKEFVYLSGKSTLKDWKRAIRLNGIMLRKIMDSGELDFYQHSRLCSNTCRSTKIDLVGSRGSLSSQQSTDTAPPTPASADDGGDDSTEWVTAIGEDTVAFWRGLRDAGLLEEVMEDLHQQVTEILKGLDERLQETPLQPKDAALLNNIVQNFGMLDLVKKVLASHKSQMDRCREQYTRSLVALEQQCDEHRKRAKELKSKSQHLNNVLMTLTPVTSPPSAKRPRLTRAASGPASVSAAQAPPSHFTLPIAQLAQSSLIGGYTLLTSPGGAELQADASNVTLLNAAPATPALVKVVSPFQLVTLPSVRALTSPVGGATGNAAVSTPLSTANAEVAKSATKQKTGQLEKE